MEPGGSSAEVRKAGRDEQAPVGVGAAPAPPPRLHSRRANPAAALRLARRACGASPTCTKQGARGSRELAARSPACLPRSLQRPQRLSAPSSAQPSAPCSSWVAVGAIGASLLASDPTSCVLSPLRASLTRIASGAGIQTKQKAAGRSGGWRVPPAPLHAMLAPHGQLPLAPARAIAVSPDLRKLILIASSTPELKSLTELAAYPPTGGAGRHGTGQGAPPAVARTCSSEGGWGGGAHASLQVADVELVGRTRERSKGRELSSRVAGEELLRLGLVAREGDRGRDRRGWAGWGRTRAGKQRAWLAQRTTLQDASPLELTGSPRKGNRAGQGEA